MNYISHQMGFFELILGLLFFLFGLILLIIQIREGVFSGKERINTGDVRIFYAITFAMLSGLYLIFSYF